ncbi:hypothetical protein CRYUN_Cryun16bG0064000 [Craigia yunnanensis]
MEKSGGVKRWYSYVNLEHFIGLMRWRKVKGLGRWDGGRSHGQMRCVMERFVVKQGMLVVAVHLRTQMDWFGESSMVRWVKDHALIVESDSKVAVDWICNKGERPWKDWKSFNEFDHLMEQIEHVYWEANFFTDSLAKMGVNREFILCVAVMNLNLVETL